MTVREVPFTDLLVAIVDNRGKTCPTAERGTPLIATNCVRNEGLYPSYETVRYVDDQVYATWFRGHPQPGDILFVCKGSPGNVAMVPDPVDFCIAQDMVAVRADPNRVYPPFLFAALRSTRVQHQIAAMHVGTLIPHFKKGDFGQLRIPLPGSAEQRFIGDLYVALSAKIESNRSRAETAEGLLDALAAVSSDLSPIALRELVQVDRTSCTPASEGNGLVDHFSIPAFDGGRLPDRTPGSTIRSNKLRVKGDSVLVSRLNPATNRTWFAVPDVATTAAASTEFLVLRPIESLGIGALWLAVRDECFRSELERRATGTSGSHQRVRPDDVLAVEVPDVRRMDIAVSTEAESLLRLAHHARIESVTLADLRDALLPVLLTARIRVPVAAELADVPL